VWAEDRGLSPQAKGHREHKSDRHFEETLDPDESSGGSQKVRHRTRKKMPGYRYRPKASRLSSPAKTRAVAKLTFDLLMVGGCVHYDRGADSAERVGSGDCVVEYAAATPKFDQVYSH
jgi:hypothetical protein